MLKIEGDVLTWTSDHFPKLYEYALQLIKSGDAYVDDTIQEEMRKERMDGLASKCRDLSVEENLKRFEGMCKATEFARTTESDLLSLMDTGSEMLPARQDQCRREEQGVARPRHLPLQLAAS